MIHCLMALEGLGEAMTRGEGSIPLLPRTFKHTDSDLRAPPGARYDPIGPGDGPPNIRGGPRFPGGGMGGPPNPFGGFGGGDFI